MTDKTSDKNLNFYLSPSGGGVAKEEPVIYKDYIISQNQLIHSNISELTLKNTELQNEKTVLEDENDHYETSTRYMKNEMKNFVELAKMHGDVRVLYGKTTDLYSELKKTNDALIKRMMVFLLMSKGVFCMFSMINWYSGWIIPSTSFDLATCAFLAVCLRLTPRSISDWTKKNADNLAEVNKINAESKKILDTIKKTDESNDFISKYIDNL